MTGKELKKKKSSSDCLELQSMTQTLKMKNVTKPKVRKFSIEECTFSWNVDSDQKNQQISQMGKDLSIYN